MRLSDLQEQVNEFVLHSPENIVADLEPLSTPPAVPRLRLWDLPLIGVASVQDPLWEKFKAVDAVGPQHLSPDEWLPGAKSVISYFLPYTAEIRQANRNQGVTATEWLYGRWEGELFNQALRRFIVGLFTKNGIKALAPALDQRFAVINRRSNWSERHVAFAAGLGTFSLSRSMITPLGSAGRIGSVIVSCDLEQTPRPYTKIEEYCIKCGACIKRCPAQAIDETGKDNEICGVYVGSTLALYAPRYGCGKCQTGVPCEAGIPGRRK